MAIDHTVRHNWHDRLTKTAAERLAGVYANDADSLRRFAIARGADPDAAGDAVAEAFLVVATLGSPRIAEIDNLRAYLFTTVRNIVDRHHRDSRRTTAVPDDVLERVPVDPEAPFALDGSIDLARRALDSLDETTRRIAIAVLIDRRPAREVGSELGLTASHVSTIAHRARSQLQVGYIRCFIELSDLSCGVSSDVLARVIVGTAGTRQLREYRRHRALCATCAKVEHEARDELSAGSLTFGLVAVAVAGASTTTRPRAAHARPRGRDLGHLALVALIAAAVASWPEPLHEALELRESTDADPGGYHVPVAVPVESPASGMSADPDRISAMMPAPGEETAWTTRLTNHAERELTVYATLSTRTTDATETPTLEVRRDSDIVAGPRSVAGLDETISLGRVDPGSSIDISGVVRRDERDRIQDLSGEASIRLTAAPWSPHDPPAGTIVPHPAVVDALPPSGATPGRTAAIALAGLAAVGSGALLVRRRSSRSAPEAR
ncbi:sigma-70 family RNA polymerase sigma factor [Microbacterium sp. NM3R9]|uniref:RNA polymerase sigma factor n=1 Tax=Microbacterium thalli TaxID=3027921 RepID=UPI002365451B|nr:sigma-70 family RNA polymerase sigma factor [Microbacterium thalli]MDN8548845.1 sigma-70 family RNA polymerase sigma factor [Microbacterium thalli]